MPLIELKTIKPVCDICGKVGSTWTNVEAGGESIAIPDGWKHTTDPIEVYEMTRTPVDPTKGPYDILVCVECEHDRKMNSLAARANRMIENDSRA